MRLEGEVSSIPYQKAYFSAIKSKISVICHIIKKPTSAKAELLKVPNA